MSEHKDDIGVLMAMPAFRRFLWRAIQSAGILAPATDGSDTRNLAYAEGRRNLGFSILRDVEDGMPASHPDSLFTLIQILREEAQSTPQEKPARGRRTNRNAELDDGADAG